MPIYSCERCEKPFKQKGHYDTHLARKNPCKKDTRIETLVEKKVQEALAKVVIAQPQQQQQSQTQPQLQEGDTVKPFLKWVGGKTQILDEVLAKFPTTIRNYYEPFVGGGSVLLGFLSRVQQKKIQLTGQVYASDLNSNLIGVYKSIQTNPDELIAEVKRLQEESKTATGTEVNRKPATLAEARTSPESYYYWTRSVFNSLTAEQRASVKGSALFLFLNKTCFRGVYREGPRGFNVPYGNYTNPSILDEDHIRTVSKLIQPVIFRTESFTEGLVNPIEGDFVYMDPPYAPETDTSFVGYTADGFGAENHAKLFAMCGQLNTNRVRFLMSNADVNLVKTAFPSPQYMTEILSCRRAIHSKKPDSKTNEVLITNLHLQT